jgi:PAS domain S-box-containing protein
LENQAQTVKRCVLALFQSVVLAGAHIAPWAPAHAQATATGFAAPSGPRLSGLTIEEQVWLKAHPTVRLGLNGVSPPYSYLVGDEYRGIHTDLILRLSRDLGIRLEPVHGQSWDELQRSVQRGAGVDLIGLLPETPERSGAMLFTDNLTVVEYALFVRDGHQKSALHSGLSGDRVAVVGSFAVRRWLERDYPGVIIVPTESTIEALRKVSLGEVDGAVSTAAGASWLIRQEGIVNLRLSQMLYRRGLALGVRADWPELVTILNKAIAQVEPAEIDRITSAHVLVDGSGYTVRDVLMALAPVVTLAAAALLLLQRRALKRERRWATQLAQREREYRLLVDNSLDGVLRSTPSGEILAANPAACAIFGLTPEELRAGGRDRVVDRDDPRLQALLRERATHGRARGTLTLRRGDGTPFEAELASAVYSDADGRQVSSIMVRDVSERHRAEAGLRLMQACVEHLNDAVIVTEAEPLREPGPRIVFVNAAFTRQTGYTADEVLGRSPRFLQGQDTSKAELRRVAASLRRWQAVHAELLNYRKDGQPYWSETQIVPVADARGNYTHWVAIQRDVTARKQAEASRRQLEQQLRESQKMEAIGTLAGGIAHDFNNILGGIVGHAALAEAAARAEGGTPSSVRESIDQIRLAADRARRLVQQILAFSRRETPLMRAQPVAPVVHETLALLRATLPANVMLGVDIATDRMIVRVDATQLQQVVLNLCTNAWQALPQGVGRVDVTVREVTLGRSDDEGIPPGRYVHLAVRDNGLGMDAATRERIFDPFFTTKSPGQGTGLGLAVVHGIVASHGGVISVESAPGRGTCFNVWLPVAELSDTEDESARVMPASPEREGRGERVLYVDDDEVMLLMVERLLQRLGYRPLCLADPRQALQAVGTTKHDEPGFDAVVTDYNMPGLNGIELARALQATVPRLPVLLSTGFIAETLRAEARDAGVRAVLRKEHTLEELGPALQRLFS